MSNPSSSPGIRSLEQLKVAELRDELRKRGLSSKGVKKELFERLEEAVSKEQLSASLGEDTEDVHEGEEQGTVVSEGMAPNISSYKDEQPGGSMPYLNETENSTQENALIVNSASPYVGALDASPVFKEPHKVAAALEPVLEESNDTREHNVNPLMQETGNVAVGNDDGHNDNYDLEVDTTEPVLDTDIQCDIAQVGPRGEDSQQVESVVLVQQLGPTASVIDSPSTEAVSQPVVGKVVTDVPITNRYISGPDASTPAMDNTVVGPVEEDVKVFEKTNLTSVSVAPFVQEQAEELDGVSCKEEMSVSQLEGSKQGELHTTSGEIEVMEIPDMSHVAKASKEYLVAEVVKDTCVSKDTSMQEAVEHMVKQEEKQDTCVSKDTSMQEAVEDMVKQEEKQDVSMLEPEEGVNVDNKRPLASIDSLIPIVDNVKSEDVVKPQPVDPEKVIGVLEEGPPAKAEPSEAESYRERPVKRERKDNKVLSGRGFDRSRSKDADLERHRHEPARCIKDGEEKNKSEGRARKVFKEERRMDRDLKTKEYESRRVFSGQKQKEEEDGKQQEPVKRARRWVGDTPKPLTTGIVKEIISPEIKKEGMPPKIPPKTMGQVMSLPTTAKVDSDSNGNKKYAPPSIRSPSASLKIERFVRPFTLKAVKDMLAEFGHCMDFWMDQIKTHCYVTFLKVDEAVAARNALYGKQWPASFGNHLVADFVDASEVKMRCDGSFEKANTAPSPTTQGLANPSSAAPPPHPSVSAPPLRERERMQPPPPVPTLDDLFRKTKAKPHIYYLPLTEEQVVGKLSTVKNRELQVKSRPVGRV